MHLGDACCVTLVMPNSGRGVQTLGEQSPSSLADGLLGTQHEVCALHAPSLPHMSFPAGGMALPPNFAFLDGSCIHGAPCVCCVPTGLMYLFAECGRSSTRCWGTKRERPVPALCELTAAENDGH